MLERVRPEYEAVGFKAGVSEGEVVGDVDCVQTGPGRQVGRECVVVAIEHDYGIGLQNGNHRSSLSGTNTDGNETLPVRTNNSAARPKLIKDSSRQTNELDGCLCGYNRRVNGCGL